MSREVWVPTAMYQELILIYEQYIKWLLTYADEFSGPDDEEIAGNIGKIDQMLCKLSDDLSAWSPRT